MMVVANTRTAAGVESVDPRSRSDDERHHAGDNAAGRARGRLLLGHAGPHPAPAGRAGDPGRLHRRPERERDLPQPPWPRRGDRDPVRPGRDELPRPPGVLLPDPRPHHLQPAGQRRRHVVPIGDLLRRRRAEADRRGHHRRRRGERAVAGQGRHRGHAGGPVLGGRAGAPGLPAPLPVRLHLPLPAAGLEAAPSGRHVVIPESSPDRDYPQIPAERGRVEPAPRRVRGFVDGVLVFDTVAARYVWEVPYYPQYYVPVKDVRTQYLVDEDHPRRLQFGTAQSHALHVNGVTVAEAVRVFGDDALPGLADTARFEWQTVEWFEEDER